MNPATNNSNSDNRITIIKNRLTKALHPTVLEIQDDSRKHKGHPGAKNGSGHFTVKIASQHFDDKSLLACHRLVYDALSTEMGQAIHALQIKIVR